MGDVYGDQRIRRTLVADRRADEGASAETLAGARVITRHDYAMLILDPDGADRNVTLPDATTLPLGWKIKIRNSGVSNDLTVRNATPTTIKTISAPAAPDDTIFYEFILVDNGVAAGTWAISEIGDFASTVKYSATFASGDWSSPSGGYRTLTYTAATHGRGVNPQVSIFAEAGSDFDEIIPDRIRINASGDVEFRIVDGLEFDGKVVIM